MRCLRKNMRRVAFKNYLGKVQIIDQDGNRTGEYTLSYSSLMEAEFNVSASRGAATNEMFGIHSNYSKALVTCDLNCPLDIYSIVWIDKPTDGPHDYVVVEKAKSVDSITYALEEVSVG